MNVFKDLLIKHSGPNSFFGDSYLNIKKKSSMSISLLQLSNSYWIHLLENCTFHWILRICCHRDIKFIFIIKIICFTSMLILPSICFSLSFAYFNALCIDEILCLLINLLIYQFHCYFPAVLFNLCFHFDYFFPYIFLIYLFIYF